MNLVKSEREEILRACSTLFVPGQVVELRALDATTPDWRKPHTASGYFDDWTKLAAAATGLTAKGIYITLNPVNPALLARSSNRVRAVGGSEATTSDADIISRRWLPIDCDPVRPSGISASDEEHAAALDRAEQVRAYLAGLGWPEPVVADSGNGAHLLYRIDLPADDDGLTAGVLAALACRFDDDLVKVDRKVANPARIWKLYGTVAAKGDHTLSRPHRVARILSLPSDEQRHSDPIHPEPSSTTMSTSERLGGTQSKDAGLSAVVADRHLLAALAAQQRQQPESPTVVDQPGSGRRGKRVAAGGFDLAAWIVAYKVPVDGPRPWRGTGKCWEFPQCPWNPDHKRSAYIVQHADGAIAAGCHHNSCAGRNWQALRARYESGAGEEQPPVHQEVDRIIAELIDCAPQGSAGERRHAVEMRASGLVERCTALSRAELNRVIHTLRMMGCSKAFMSGWDQQVVDAGGALPGIAADDDAPEYVEDGGCMYRCYYTYTADGRCQLVSRKCISDYWARVVEQSKTDDDSVYFTLAGGTKTGDTFRMTMPVERFFSDRDLKSALAGVVGAGNKVHHGMASHLAPAIQSFSDVDLPLIRRYERSGWLKANLIFADQEDEREPVGLGNGIDAGLRFLVPGRPIQGASVHLCKLPYYVPAHTSSEELRLGIGALDAALEALDPVRTTVIVSLLFGAPFARLAGWAGHRYGVFIAGRTGSLKTSLSQVLMCVYGARFKTDQGLLKLGSGSTSNALGGHAVQVHDLPLLLDNYKPNTGNGEHFFIDLVHHLFEGEERERLGRDARLIRSRPLGCWPLFTGEDVPTTDAATLARLLVVQFEASAGCYNTALAHAQANICNLPAVGAAWFDWLESAEGQAAGAAAAHRFKARHAEWSRCLANRPLPGINPLRVAEHLTSNELTWAALCSHPHLGPVLQKHTAAHAAGLQIVANDMARYTTTALEATRFLEGLAQAMIGKQCRLATGLDALLRDMPSNIPAVGWIDSDNTICLLPDLARTAAERVKGLGALNKISNEALGKQLRDLGHLASHDPEQGTRTRWIGSPSNSQRIYHLVEGSLSVPPAP